MKYLSSRTKNPVYNRNLRLFIVKFCRILLHLVILWVKNIPGLGLFFQLNQIIKIVLNLNNQLKVRIPIGGLCAQQEHVQIPPVPTCEITCVNFVEHSVQTTSGIFISKTCAPHLGHIIFKYSFPICPLVS